MSLELQEKFEYSLYFVCYACYLWRVFNAPWYSSHN
jgi:hypothetical protein